MKFITQIKVVLLNNQQQDCKAYIEEIPHIRTSGRTLAEAKENLILELKNYERETYSSYSIAEYKFKTTSLL